MQYANTAGTTLSSPNWLKVGDDCVKIISEDKSNNLITVEIPDKVAKNYLFYAGFDFPFIKDAASEFKIESFGTVTELGQFNSTVGIQFRDNTDIVNPWPVDGTILNTSNVTAMNRIFRIVLH